MESNFDLSFPDDDEWLDNLETEDDYKEREEYNRSWTPPSPSLLEQDDDDEATSPAQAAAVVQRQGSSNPFVDDDDTEDFQTPIAKILSFDMENLNVNKVLGFQDLVIDYYQVSRFLINCRFLVFT